MSASKYAFLGGFDSTSNVKAGHIFGIKVSGTHAHSFVQSYRDLTMLKSHILDGHNIVSMALAWRDKVSKPRFNARIPVYAVCLHAHARFLEPRCDMIYPSSSSSSPFEIA